jgi:predicted enzyme related to lactoylglutathione lyase
MEERLSGRRLDGGSMTNNVDNGKTSVPLIRKLDCYSLPVDDLDAAIAFYVGLGHELFWRDGNESAGLRMPDTDAEIVLRTDHRPIETCLAVTSVPEAIERITQAGGTLVFGPIEIRIGLYALLQDPWKNPLAILDFSKGLLATDADGNVIGNQPTTEDTDKRKN